MLQAGTSATIDTHVELFQLFHTGNIPQRCVSHITCVDRKPPEFRHSGQRFQARFVGQIVDVEIEFFPSGACRSIATSI